MQILNNPIPYLPYMYTNVASGRNFHVFEEIGVEKYDDDVIFKNGCGNMAVLRMCNEKCLTLFSSIT